MKHPEYQTTLKEFKKYGYNDQDWIYSFWKKQPWEAVMNFEAFIKKIAETKVETKKKNEEERSSTNTTQLNLTHNLQIYLSGLTPEERKKYIEEHLLKK